MQTSSGTSRIRWITRREQLVTAILSVSSMILVRSSGAAICDCDAIETLTGTTSDTPGVRTARVAVTVSPHPKVP
jgi:hypothetical protein